MASSPTSYPAEVATRAGFPGPRMVAEARETRWKSSLRAATERAELMGICGAPSFVVRDPSTPLQQLMFWGQDRLMLVEKALADDLHLRGLQLHAAFRAHHSNVRSGGQIAEQQQL